MREVIATDADARPGRGEMAVTEDLEQLIRLYDALFAQGGAERLELLILSGAGHGGDAFDDPSQ
jgi:hypothetical protein